MKVRNKIIYIVIFLLPLCLWAHKPDPKEQKVVQAVRANGPINLDGVLEENAWQTDGYNSFVQSDPEDGAQPSEETYVWIAYDEEALYVAARLFDTEPQQIVSRLGRRDDFLDSDWFIFAVDPYLDKRTGFQFAVNPAGSIVDWTLYNDEWSDTTWDGVWECASHIDDKGWAVEIRIPYNQLRFPKKEEYVWGVNFRRVIQRKNEKVCFIWVPKEESGYVSRFAQLVGIKGIKPGRLIEILPYTVGQAQFNPAEEGNPFQTGQNFLGNTGFDIKVGLKSSLTLDATVNPDFGQVEVDPAVINLSAYETYYSEKRPFFIEGSDIFNAFGRGGLNNNVSLNWSSPSFFYSRRIGRTPRGDVSQDGYVNIPGRSTILGAFKLTGKVANCWNLSFINALTAREYAEIDLDGNHFQEEVEAFSHYGILRAQREFNEGRQGIGFLATSVIRDLRVESLEDILNKRAFSLAIDGWTFLNKDKAWVISGWIGATRAEGSQTAMTNLQESSIHYFQRPDATHVALDEEATSLSGWGGRVMLNKQKGNIFFNVALGALSPGFNPNDAGFQYGESDIINGHLIAGYVQPHPGKIFRRWEVLGGPFGTLDFGRIKTWEGWLLAANAQLLNYWTLDTMLAYNPETISNTRTRGGPLTITPGGRQLDLGVYSDSRKPIVLSAYGGTYVRPTEAQSWNAGTSIRWKPKSNISFSFGPDYSFSRSKLQWVTSVEDSLMTSTYGTRYIFGRIKQKTLSSSIRLDWTFTPKMSIQLYLQPFLAIGHYDEFKELAKPKSFEYNIFGDSPSTLSYLDEEYTVDPDGSGPASAFSFENPDFNYKSLRGTLVIRWEYLPGSILYLVWTQNRADYSNPGDFNFRRDLGDLLTAPGDNIFLIKVSYRWAI